MTTERRPYVPGTVSELERRIYAATGVPMGFRRWGGSRVDYYALTCVACEPHGVIGETYWQDAPGGPDPLACITVVMMGHAVDAHGLDLLAGFAMVSEAVAGASRAVVR